MQKIYSLDLDKSKENAWDELLDGHSLHKLLYSMNIVGELLRQKEWREEFVLKGGLSHLIKQII